LECAPEKKKFEQLIRLSPLNEIRCLALSKTRQITLDGPFAKGRDGEKSRYSPSDLPANGTRLKTKTRWKLYRRYNVIANSAKRSLMQSSLNSQFVTTHFRL